MKRTWSPPSAAPTCRSRQVTAALLMWLSTCAMALAQLVSFSDPDQFSAEALRLSFEEFQGAQADLSSAYSSVGIFFAGEGGSRPMAGRVILSTSPSAAVWRPC
ncbi:MAG: hypothetical protein ACE5JX_08935 [Acidobacteriota bacterium]